VRKTFCIEKELDYMFYYSNTRQRSPEKLSKPAADGD
jgi:hypothetical protein